MLTSSVSTRGQLVIPYKLRKKYDIKPHTMVRWIDTGEGIMLIPYNNANNIIDPVTSSRGMLKGTKVSTRTLLEAKKEDKLLEEKGTLVTGDPELKPLESNKKAEILWIR